MTTYTITLIVSMPIGLVLAWILLENFELAPWFQYPVCYATNIARGLRIYLAFNSLVVATMRYSFIVNRHAIFRFGVEKAKTLFHSASIAIPITIEILLALTHRTNYVFSAANSACKESYQDSYNRTKLNVTRTEDFSLPVYSLVHRYISPDVTYYVRTFVYLLVVLIFSNVIEGVLYYKTFAKIKR